MFPDLLNFEISVSFLSTGASGERRKMRLWLLFKPKFIQDSLRHFEMLYIFLGGFLWGSSKACGLFEANTQKMGKEKSGENGLRGAHSWGFTKGLAGILSFTPQLGWPQNSW